MKYIISTLLVCAGSVASAGVCHGASWSVASPNGSIVIIVELRRNQSTAAAWSCRVVVDNQEVLPSAPLGINLKRLGSFTAKLKNTGQSTRTVDEKYTHARGQEKGLRQPGERADA